MKSAPVFILGVHKSGTSLLRNLLDGHQQLSVLPVETHFPLCLGLPTQYPRKLPGLQSPGSSEEFGARLRFVLEAYNESTDNRTDAFLPEAADLDVFNEQLGTATSGPISDRWRVAMGAVLGAYDMQQLPEQALVEKSVTNLEHAHWLQQEFPEARFIVIIRNPYANLVSMRKFFTRGNCFPSLSQPLRILEMGFHFAALYQRTLSNTLFIRYEDLVTKPEESMTQVADHLQIDFEKCLLEPSSRGSDWTGNSTSGKPLHGISSSRLELWKSDITGIEAELINRSDALQTHMKSWSYNTFRMGGVMKPAPKEPWRTYLRNRAFMWFSDGS